MIFSKAWAGNFLLVTVGGTAGLGKGFHFTLISFDLILKAYLLHDFGRKV